MSSLVDRQSVDLAGQPRGPVGNDPLHRLQPVLDRAEFSAQLRIFAGEQLNPLLGLPVRAGMKRLTPRGFQRIAVPDFQPSDEHPAAYTDRNDASDDRQRVKKRQKLVHTLRPYLIGFAVAESLNLPRRFDPAV